MHQQHQRPLPLDRRAQADMGQVEDLEIGHGPNLRWWLLEFADLRR